MNRPTQLVAILSLILVINACKKTSNSDGSCKLGIGTTRIVANKQATVKVDGTIYSIYFVEDGTIDSKLIPCILPPAEFIQNNLQVTISGEVKATKTALPCCANDFLITAISR